MKIIVTRKCGHEDEFEMRGSARERERRIAELEREPCFNCQVAEINAKRGMAKLEGSKKQIVWADSIRSQMLDSVEKWRNEKHYYAKKEKTPKDEVEEMDDNLDRVKRALQHEKKAKWFIDNRFSDIPTIVNVLYREKKFFKY